ncbi:MAG: UvrD-helicase domain-containing protein [Treponema sp.]|jgi:DNA helicase-2/ATP-dependent DNA helicase PcrA|nr:UvrD-helicase domain-containing protein [Treponema sp.]
MKNHFEKELNGPQLLAVTTIEGPVLIIAGAGSGKTRVITYRIAHILEKGVPQSAILALTFTNKAAREMEERVKALTGKKLQNLTVSTFHAFGVKILRDEIEALGYRKNFSIYDEADRLHLIKESLRECRVSAEGVDLYSLAQLFSHVKEGRLAFGRGANPEYEHVYREYQHGLKAYNALDFDDLLVLPIRLFEEHPDILEKYHKRYRYIMVDEFQDTSLTQYRITRLIALGPAPAENAGGNRAANVCVVGDDDQSIYSWRGANYENLLIFEKDFPSVVEIKLEQNYRSTTTILEAANGVISNNSNRKEKILWSGKTGGKPIEFYTPENESDEADFIAERVHELCMRERLSYDSFGVLVRSNSMFRSIEEAFLAQNIPYRVSGGQSFFARKEIKDVLSYLRVIANSDDDINLLRIINIPRRGIGKTTIAMLGELAKKNHSSIWDALNRWRYALEHGQENLFEGASLAPDAVSAHGVQGEAAHFISVIEFFKGEILRKGAGKGWALSEKVRALVDNIDYWSYLVSENSKNEKAAKWKFGYVESLIRSIETWEKDPDNLDPTLYPYLNRVSLITRDDGGDEAGKGKVNLMTIHASKGLEFPVVFIAGAEDGIIPHEKSLGDAADEEDGENEGLSAPHLSRTQALEEERRLFYVAITRARDKLFITSCRTRRRFQGVAEHAPSPFLSEIPDHLVEFHEMDRELETAEAEDFFARIKSRFTV